MRSSPFSRYLLFIGVTIVAFFPLASAGFILWDDHDLLTAFPPVLNFDLKEILFNLKVGGLFPLSLLSLAVQNQIHGLDPFYYHVANILLHLANGYLVYLCARNLFGLKDWAAVCAAVLFLVHPLRVESVGWISGGRKDLLCTFFFLSCLLCYRRNYYLALALGACALLSKAMAISLPLAILLTYPILKERLAKKDLLKAAPFALLAVIALILEMKGQRTGEVLAESGSVASGLLNGFTAVAFSAARTFLPNALAIFYEPGAFHFTTLDFAGMALSLAFCALLLFRGFKDWWALALFFVLALPVLKFVPFGQASVFNDRYLYLPGIATSIFFVQGLAYLRLEKLAWIPVIPLIFLSHLQSKTWYSQETVWVNVLNHYPQTKKAYQNLSLYYIDNQMNQEALAVTLKSQQLTPGDLSTKINLGVLYSRMERYADAEKTFLEVLKVEPNNVVVHHNLAFAYARAGYKNEAIAHYREALRLDPNFQPSITALAELNQGAAAGSPGGIKAGSPEKK